MRENDPLSDTKEAFRKNKKILEPKITYFVVILN